MIKNALRLVLPLFAVTSLAGCFEPIQGGGVVIIGDPSERIAALCRFRYHGAGSDSVCAGEAPTDAAADSTGAAADSTDAAADSTDAAADSTDAAADSTGAAADSTDAAAEPPSGPAPR